MCMYTSNLSPTHLNNAYSSLWSSPCYSIYTHLNLLFSILPFAHSLSAYPTNPICNLYTVSNILKHIGFLGLSFGCSFPLLIPLLRDVEVSDFLNLLHKLSQRTLQFIIRRTCYITRFRPIGICKTFIFSAYFVI